MEICIYGTVYNNASYVEESIKSIYRPEYHVVIVDNYSTDGTWERLLELRKEYNLQLYRYRCSRGLGRNIALHKCPENSLTAYFDLDTIYYDAYHRVIHAAETYGSASALGVVVVNREYAIRRGGWRDLNVGEDTDFSVRMNPAVHIPVIIGENALPSTPLFRREKRYAGGLKAYYKRFVKNHLDYSRATGLSTLHMVRLRSKRLILLSPLILPYLRFKKPYRYYDKLLNITTGNIQKLQHLLPPREAGISERLFFLNIDKDLCRAVRDCKDIDGKILNAVSRPLIRLESNNSEFWRTYIKDPHLVFRMSPLLARIHSRFTIL